MGNGLQIPLKNSSAHLYANGVIATGTGVDALLKKASAEPEYAFYTYLHCKLKFKEGYDGKMNFLADSAMSESHNMCVLLDRQSLNWQDEQSSACLPYSRYFYEQNKLSVCLRSLHHGSGALYAT